MASLKTIFNLLAEHEGLLRALHESSDGLTAADLAVRLRGRADDAPLQPVLQRLLDLGIVEERPGESVYLELSLPVRAFLGHLLRAHELVTPEAIRGYVQELDGQGRALLEALAVTDAQAAVLALERMAAAIERVRSYAQANHGAILERVMRAKAGADGYSVRERFLRINALWEDFLSPLRALVEPGEWAHAAFDRSGEVLSQAREVFIVHGVVSAACERVRARLLRMRAAATACYTEAYRELLPLYERARRQNLIAEGCARWLEHWGRHGATRLASALPIARVRWQGQFSDVAVEARLLALVRFDPRPPPPLGNAAAARPEIVSLSSLRRQLVGELPQADLLAWLAQALPAAPLTELVRAYVGLATTLRVDALKAGSECALDRPDGRVSYCPLPVIAAAP